MIVGEFSDEPLHRQDYLRALLGSSSCIGIFHLEENDDVKARCPVPGLFTMLAYRWRLRDAVCEMGHLMQVVMWLAGCNVFRCQVDCAFGGATVISPSHAIALDCEHLIAHPSLEDTVRTCVQMYSSGEVKTPLQALQDQMSCL